MKVKVLIFGPIEGSNADAFVKKLKALHSSKAGPFDAAFSVGKASIRALKEYEEEIPVALYLQDIYENDYALQPVPGETGASKTNDDRHPPISLGRNLYLLQNADKSGGVWSLKVNRDKPEIVVCSVPTHFRTRKAGSLIDTLQHVSYTGCDLLLSSEWPQGIEGAFPATPNDPPVSFDVADVALKARSRYHFAPGSSFAQSHPFGHLAATTSSMKPRHVGRFISLHPVESDIVDKQKQKFVHAIGFNPLHHMNDTELNDQRATIPCPFTDDAYTGDNATSSNRRIGNSKLSEASARRILAEEQGKGNMGADGRWAGSKRRHNPDSPPVIDKSSKSLFVHGLHKDVSGRLQSGHGNTEILSSLPGSLEVRFPAGVSAGTFCFVDFPSHEDALTAWQMTGGEINVNGVQLTVKWGSTRKIQQESSKKRRLTEAEAKNSTVLYFKLPRETTDFHQASEDLRLISERTLEEALSDGENIVRAEDEPALRVQVRSKEEYGFLDFASHAAASMALATLTGSTDGGKAVLEGTKLTPNFQDLLLFWSESKSTDQIIDDNTGFKFERKHFPTDSRKDCWFCLASESCEKHLITGIYQNFYSAMPKGPVHKSHVLLIPVQHTSEGILMDPSLASELESLKKKIHAYFQNQLGMDTFLFERAIQTKGGYHSHVQCLPIDKKFSHRIEGTLKAQAKQARMNLHEVSPDVDIQNVIDDERDGYFYAEICTDDGRKCFLHSSDKNVCPLQFGREVVAAVLGKPELAHWKSSTYSKAEEERMASDLRSGLSHLNNDDN